MALVFLDYTIVVNKLNCVGACVRCIYDNSTMRMYMHYKIVRMQ